MGGARPADRPLRLRPLRYAPEPADPERFTRDWDRYYTRIARFYDTCVRWLPFWRRWIGAVLPHVRGPRVLEVSFGTGHLLTRYPGDLEVHGVDLNRRMVETARANLQRTGSRARLVRGNVERLPYRDGVFDSVVSTMAFSGYPDGERALDELLRVLRPGGRLAIVDVNFPLDDNRVGRWVAGGWQRAGDVLRDMPTLFRARGIAL